MKNIITLGLLLSFAGISKADMIGYGTRDCIVMDEERGLLRNNEVCIQEVSCKSYRLNNPGFYTEVRNTAYCRPNSRTNRCLSAADCIADSSIAADDIPEIGPVSRRPSRRINCDEDSVSSRGRGGSTGRSGTSGFPVDVGGTR